MKITQSQLRRIIKEELRKVLNEGRLDPDAAVRSIAINFSAGRNAPPFGAQQFLTHLQSGGAREYIEAAGYTQSPEDLQQLAQAARGVFAEWQKYANATRGEGPVPVIEPRSGERQAIEVTPQGEIKVVG